jgi:23S rRNA (cytosine1962-C5)-methyltransferase
MKKTGVILQRGKDKAVRNRHHWIFSGAVAAVPDDAVDGGLYPVLSRDGDLLGHAMINRKCSILGRMVSFGRGDPLAAMQKSIVRAAALRKDIFGSSDKTNAFRLINAEGDGLPGLIVDRYADVLVVQITTLGMERLKEFIVSNLVESFRPSAVYEKSDLPSRREEGLKPCEGILVGRLPETLRIKENGLSFAVNVAESQKTGFYLDQREMRAFCGGLAGERTVLNAFGYTGGFSVYALRGGAARVDTVDTSKRALEEAVVNFRLNGYDPDHHGFIEADVFEFLRSPAGDYDLIILDPPAFAKKKADVRQACRGYKDINRLAIQKAAAGGIVMTFSCSHFVDERLFRQIVFQASAEAGRNVRIVQRHRLGPDHPINVYHPETEYLKGLVLYID